MKIVVAVLAVVYLLIPLHSHAQKILVDPNTPQPVLTAATIADDERLIQKITYKSTDKRLHAVVAEVSEKTGVAIRFGKNDDDWQVRDLPIVISCKDLPLGKLLQAITDSTHTVLSSSVVNDVTIYRIVADDHARKRVNDALDARRKSRLDLASWSWDAWAVFGAIPDTKVKPAAGSKMQAGSGAYHVARGIAHIISKLGPSAKESIFSGKVITLGARDGEFAQEIAEIYNNWWALCQEGYLQFVAENQDLIRDNPEFVVDDPVVLTEDDLKMTNLIIEIGGGKNPMLVVRLEGAAGTAENPVSDPSAWVSDFIPGFPPSPQMPLSVISDVPDSYADFDSEDPQALALSQVKVKLTEQKQRFADIVAALAESSGYSIVYEDFRSHRDGFKQNVYAGLFETETTVTDIISQLQARGDSEKWYVNGRDKLIIGHPYTWYERHQNLVPESLITYLQDKLNGTGIELDDAVAVMRLSDGQYGDWIRESSDLRAVEWECDSGDEPVWKFYDSLSGEDKARARSEQGLPLAGFDSRLLVQVFEDISKGVATQAQWEAVELAKVSPELVNQHFVLSDTVIIPTDPDVLSKLTLYVRERKILPFAGTDDNTVRSLYEIEVKGEDTNMKFNGPEIPFPIYSEAREKAVREENRVAAENKQ